MTLNQDSIDKYQENCMSLNQDSIGNFQKRLERIHEDSTPQWGKLKPIDLMAHLRRFFEISLGQITVKDYSTPLVSSLIFLLFFRLFTNWPQSKFKKVSIFFPETERSNFTNEQRMTIDLLGRFVFTAAQHPEQKAVHPIFGYIRLAKWEIIHGVHLSHHLRQFGV